MPTTNVSVTIDVDLLNAIHAMRGDVSLSRFLSNLAFREAAEQGINLAKQDRKIVLESMFE